MAADASELPLQGRAERGFSPPRTGRREPRPVRSFLWILFPMAFAVRLFYDASRQLVPDEAFYWVLSRHLAPGYLDHPPMVALVIRAGTFVFGSNELGVRGLMSVLCFLSVLVLLVLCRRMLRDDRAVFWLGIIWLCSPLMAALATLATPDTPAVFFSVCAMALAILATYYDSVVACSAELSTPFRRRWRVLLFWLAFGLCTGLALLSKYTSVLPALAVAIALLTTAGGRRQLRTLGPWLSIIVAIAVFWPVIHWNAAHQWASFKFQLNHGLTDDEQRSHLKGIGDFLLGQFGVWTPLLMIVGLVVTIKNWVRYHQLDLGMRILVCSATVPLVFFAIAAIKSGGSEANWPAFAYFPMSILIVEDLHQDWKRSGFVWVKFGIALALLICIVMQSPELVFKVVGRKHFPRKMDEVFGWKEMARSVQQERGFDELVVADRHQLAGELAFYLPGQPDVWCYPINRPDGQLKSRPTSFDYMPDRPDLSKVQDVLYVGSNSRDFCRQYGFTAYLYSNWIIPLHGQDPRERSITNCSRRIIMQIPIVPATTSQPATRPTPTTRAATEHRHRASAE